MKICIHFMLMLMCCVTTMYAADENKQYQTLAYSAFQGYTPSKPINIRPRPSEINSQPLCSSARSDSSTTSISPHSFSSSSPDMYMWPKPSAPPATIDTYISTSAASAQSSSILCASYGTCMPARGSEHISGQQAEIISLVSKLRIALKAIPEAHRTTHVKTLLTTLTDDGNLEIAVTATERGTKTGNGQQRDFRNIRNTEIQNNVKKIVAALTNAHAIAKK